MDRFNPAGLPSEIIAKVQAVADARDRDGLTVQVDDGPDAGAWRFASKDRAERFIAKQTRLGHCAYIARVNWVGRSKQIPNG